MHRKAFPLKKKISNGTSGGFLRFGTSYWGRILSYRGVHVVYLGINCQISDKCYCTIFEFFLHTFRQTSNNSLKISLYYISFLNLVDFRSWHEFMVELEFRNLDKILNKITGILRRYMPSLSWHGRFQLVSWRVAGKPALLVCFQHNLSSEYPDFPPCSPRNSRTKNSLENLGIWERSGHILCLGKKAS
jgi:hypothetical protein